MRSDEMTDQRYLLLSLSKRIVDRELTIATGGNVSTRLPGERVLITPAKSHKSLSDLRPAELSVVDMSGRSIGGPRPSNELPMHLAIYSSAASVKWIVHAHPPLTMAYSSERTLPELPIVEVLSLRMSFVEAKEPGSEELARAVADRIGSGSNAVLLEGHGVVVTSERPEEAFMLLEEVESACKIDLARKILKLRPE